MDDTSADLRSLLDHLKGAQHALIEDAARQPGLPSTAIIRKIAELENAMLPFWPSSRSARAADDPITLLRQPDARCGGFQGSAG